MLLLLYACTYSIAINAFCNLVRVRKSQPNRHLFTFRAANLNEHSKMSTINVMEQTSNASRKKHSNKYSNFSKKNELDPLEEAIQKAASAEEQKKRLFSGKIIRGTTVPTYFGSTHVKKQANSSVSFGNVSNIVPSDPFTFGYIRIGSIIGPHGVKGELKAKLETDFAESRISPKSVLYIKKTNRLAPRPITVQFGRRQVDDMYLLSFEDITTRTGAMVLKNYEIFVKSADRPELGRDEYLIRDLVGLQCHLVNEKAGNIAIEAGGGAEAGVVATAKGPMVGVVVGVVPPDELCSPAVAALMHSMLEVRKAGSKELVLVPLVPSIVVSVDLVQGTILLDPPKGLLEVTYLEKEKIVLKGFLPEVAGAYLAAWERSVLERNSLFVSPLA